MQQRKSSLHSEACTACIICQSSLSIWKMGMVFKHAAHHVQHMCKLNILVQSRTEIHIIISNNLRESIVATSNLGFFIGCIAQWFMSGDCSPPTVVDSWPATHCHMLSLLSAPSTL